MPEFITELLTNHPWLIVAIKVLGVFAVVMPMVASVSYTHLTLPTKA